MKLKLMLCLAVALGLSQVPFIVEALPATCLPTPFPTTPVPPLLTITRTDHTLVLWRQVCTDGSGEVAALVRMTPTPNVAPFVCSVQFTLAQNGIQFNGRIAQAPGQSFCSNLFIATTFLLLQDLGQSTNLDASKAFTLFYAPTSIVSTLEVPAFGPSAPSPPSVLVVATACTTCHSGQVVAYEMHFTNPGAPFFAEIKGGARFPDGSILPLVNQAATLPSGASVLTLVSAQALPGGLPTIDLLVEAAILEPALGVTLSRHNVTLHLLP